MFESFFLAGFECSTGYNRFGNWIDQVAATEHDRFLDDDYGLVVDAGMAAVREGVRWPLVDRDGQYDFSSLYRTLDAANKHEIEVIHDLFHFGYPQGWIRFLMIL